MLLYFTEKKLERRMTILYCNLLQYSEFNMMFFGEYLFVLQHQIALLFALCLNNSKSRA